MTEKIPYEDFSKLDLIVGTIISAKEHPNADKLLVLEVDLGEEKHRTIVAGLKATHSPDSLTGKQAIFVANLAPAKLRGVESNGMILACDSPQGPVLLNVEKQVSNGSKIK